MDRAPVFQRGHARVFAEKAAERRLGGESALSDNVFYRYVCVSQECFYSDNGVIRNHIPGGLTVYFLYDFGKIQGDMHS